MAPTATGSLPTTPAWEAASHDARFRLHSEGDPVPGRACTEAGDCFRSDDDGYVVVTGLERGRHTLQIRRPDGLPTLLPLFVEQDLYAAHEAYTYSERGFLDWFLGDASWYQASTGVVDVWVLDGSAYGPPAIEGARIDASAGEIWVSPNGFALEAGSVTRGGPNWIVNVPPGTVQIEVTLPDGDCWFGPFGWPAAGSAAVVEVPVQAGFVTTLGIRCAPGF